MKVSGDSVHYILIIKRNSFCLVPLVYSMAKNKSSLFVYFDSVQQLEPPIVTSTATGYQSPRLPATTQFTTPEIYAQPTQLVGSKVMKKYTGNGKNSRNLTRLVSTRAFFSFV